MRLKQAVIGGKVLKVGSWVGFKSGLEQRGEITDISMNDWGREILTIWNPDGIEGGFGYHGNTTIFLPAEDCWIL
jgi:hypothetical protein